VKNLRDANSLSKEIKDFEAMKEGLIEASSKQLNVLKQQHDIIYQKDKLPSSIPMKGPPNENDRARMTPFETRRV
jgi:hypothetical protein